MHFAYLHGFASGPKSSKGRALQHCFDKRGHRLHLPDLNTPSFERLSLGAMVEAMERLDREVDDSAPWGLIGSSLGGWVASRFASLHPERVQALLLLCPAFDLAERWPALLPEGGIDLWARVGSLPMADGAGKLRPVHHGFYVEACRVDPRPSVDCPTYLVHGCGDDRVPIESSRRYVQEQAQAHLIEVEDGHQLLNTLELIEGVATELFLDGGTVDTSANRP